MEMKTETEIQRTTETETQLWPLYSFKKEIENINWNRTKSLNKLLKLNNTAVAGSETKLAACASELSNHHT